MADVNHTTRKHAILSASGSSRWLNCTPSVMLEQKYYETNKRTSSVYAEEGTLAHEFGDINLRFTNGEITKAVHTAQLKKLRKHKLYTSEMEGEVSKYTSLVAQRIEELENEALDIAELQVEARLDFSRYVPGGFGTGDATIICGGYLDIIDLKYGKGVKVEALENSQLMLYALGAIKNNPEVHTVSMTISQPRLDHVSTWVTSADYLIKWGETLVKPRADKAIEGKGLQKAGDWCKWCAVKGMCATLAAKNVKLAQHEFKSPHLLSIKQILEVVSQIPMLVDWANSVKAHMLKEALAGRSFSGYKVVEGKSNRVWVEDKEYLVREKLESLGLDEEDYIESKIMSPAKVEALIGKDKIYLIKPYIAKPPGPPTLALESDNRKPFGLSRAIKDFS